MTINMIMKKTSINFIIISVLFTICFTKATAQTSGSVDYSFAPVTGLNSGVNCIALQPDGRMIVGGYLNSFNLNCNRISRNRIARLNADGSLDTTFDPGTGFDGIVECLALQPDGKVIVGGNYANFNGIPRRSVARLNADGSLDFAFNSLNGFSLSGGPVYSLALQPDGKVIVGGIFTAFNGMPRFSITRLNADGSLDITFNPGTGFLDSSVPYNAGIRSLALQPDGKVIAGGNFTGYNGTARNYIVRLNGNGSLDATFNLGTGLGFNGVVTALALQPDGKVIAAGFFTSFNGTSLNRIARLNGNNGSLDVTFDPLTGFDQIMTTGLALQPDGKVIVVGNFTSFNGTGRNGIARLNANGSLDFTFDPGTGFVMVSTSPASAIVLQPDGKVIVGGGFSSFNNTGGRLYITRLNANGSLDTTDFNYVTGGNWVESLVLQPDGKVIVGAKTVSWDFNSLPENSISRLDAYGRFDPSFKTTAENVNGRVTALALQPDGKVIAGGDFINFNGISHKGICRLNNDGSLDASFDPGTGFDGSGSPNLVCALAIQPDGKVIAGGTFNKYKGAACQQIVRLNTDGSLDNTFNTGSGFSVFGGNVLVCSIVLQPDGKVIVGGTFESFNGTGRKRIVRLNGDGSLDATFDPGTGFNLNNFPIYLALQPDGKVIVGGGFTSFNGTSCNDICRLNANGSLDNTFNSGAGFNGAYGTVWDLALQPDGKVIAVGSFTTFNGVSRNHIARINADGSLDTSFDPGSGFADLVMPSHQICALALQPDGKVIAGGTYFSHYNNSPRFGILRIHSLWTGARPLEANFTADKVSICKGLEINFSDRTLFVTDTVPVYTGSCAEAEINTNGPTAWEWSFPGGTPASSNLQNPTVIYHTAGTYDVRLIVSNDYERDTLILSNYITVNDLPVVSISGNTDFCAGDSVLLDAGAGFAAYTWSTDAVGQTIYTDLAGDYSVTVTDNNNCMATDTITINEPAVITLDVAATASNCNQSDGEACVTASGSASGGYTYLWNDPGSQTDSCAIGLAAGIYEVIVTDADNCKATATAILNDLGGAIVTVDSVKHVTCNGGNNGAIYITATGGAAPFTYAWSNNANTKDITGLLAGTYHLTVSDANGCNTSVIAIASEPPVLSATVTNTTHVICNGENNGAINISVIGGTMPYSYAWSDMSTTKDISNLAAGPYNVTVTDSKGCTTTTGSIITEPLVLSATVTEVAHLLCNGDNTGAINIAVSGGTGAYSYSWSNMASTKNISNLAAGAYNVIVTDANNCTATTGDTITEPSVLSAIVSNISHVSCYGSNTGAINITVSGGTEGYSYLWSNSATTKDISDLGTGTYSLTVTDNNGCVTSITDTVTGPEALSLVFTNVNHLSCKGDANGTATVNVSGGVPPYTYAWSPTGNTNAVNTGLSAGTYTVEVMDANNCRQSASVTINEPDSIVVAVIEDVTVCEGENAILSASATGGTAPYTYTWNPGTLNGSPITLSPSNDITYTVIVTDQNNCTGAPQSVNVFVNPIPVISFTADPESGCAPLCVLLSNQTPNTGTANWSFGDGQVGTGSVITHCYPLAGIYSVSLIVTDNNGCTNSLSTPDLINVFPNPIADFTMTPPISATVSTPVLFNDKSTGGDHWFWNFGDILNSVSTLQSPVFTYPALGSFIVNLRVTNKEGCADTASHTIIIEPEFTLYIPNAFTPDGDGINDFFVPKGAEFDSFEMEIYNRWGEKVAHPNPSRGEGLWDGTINGEAKAPQGVYIYKIWVKDFKGEMHYYVGNVTLIR